MRRVIVFLFVVCGVAAGFAQRFGTTSSGDLVIFIDKDGAAYGWGKNTYFFPLGIGDSEINVRIPTRIGMPDSLSHWLAATASIFNGAFIGNDSNLYFTGRGRLPTYFDENDTLFTPTLLPKPPGVSGWKSVSFYHDAAHIAVTGRGRAYYWDRDHPDPTFIPLPQGINRWEEAIAGYGYYLLLTDDGSLFGFGGNDNGQLGNRSSEYKSTPTRVYNPIGVYKWKSMAAGTLNGYSLGLDEHGKLYSWGVLYAAGSIGGEYIDSTKYEPAAYPSTESWEKVVIGGDIVLGLTQEGKIFIGAALIRSC